MRHAKSKTTVHLSQTNQAKFIKLVLGRPLICNYASLLFNLGQQHNVLEIFLVIFHWFISD